MAIPSTAAPLRPKVRSYCSSLPPRPSQHTHTHTHTHTQPEEKAIGWVLSHMDLGHVIPGRSPDAPESLLHQESEDDLVSLMGSWEELMK